MMVVVTPQPMISVGRNVDVLWSHLDDGRADPNAQKYEAMKAAFMNADNIQIYFLMNDDRFQPTMPELKDIYHNTLHAQAAVPPEVDRLYTEAAVQGYGVIPDCPPSSAPTST
jgi:hypothetical protein